MGRRVALAAGVGALLGLAWWGVFEFIASGAICSKDESFDCLGTAVIAVPVFTAVAAVLGWFGLRGLKVSGAGLIALPATLMSAAAVLFLAAGLPYFAAPIFALLYALLAVLTARR